LVEQCPFKAWVEGSNPSALTRFFFPHWWICWCEISTCGLAADSFGFPDIWLRGRQLIVHAAALNRFDGRASRNVHTSITATSGSLSHQATLTVIVQ
jgi:hypothetical protein